MQNHTTFNRVLRTRDQVTNQTITDIENQIREVITTYKKIHEGIFEEFKHGAAIEILDKLDADINTLVQNSHQYSPFEQFEKILNSVHSKFELLDNAKEFDLIRQFQVILAKQLELQQEADWEQKKIDYKSEYLAERIDYCLVNLSDEVSVIPEENRIWMYLRENFTQKLDEGNLTTLLSQLRHRFGLTKMSALGGDSRNPYQNYAVQNRYSSVIILPANAVIPLKNERYPGTLYLKQRKDEVEIYIFEESHPILLSRDQYQALRETGLDFATLTQQEISDKSLISAIEAICALNMGCLEKIISNADQEIQSLEKKHGCLNFSEEQKNVIDEFNVKKGNEIRQTKFLINNKFTDEHDDRFDKTVMEKIYQLEESLQGSQLELTTSQRSLLNGIKEIFNLKMKIHHLRGLVNRAKNIVLESDADKAELIYAILSDKDGMFSLSIKKQIEALVEQLKIWTLEKIATLCREYLEYYAEKWHVVGGHVILYENPWKFLAEEFIYPVIDELIHPLKYILHVERAAIDFGIAKITNDLKDEYVKILKEINKKSQAGQEDILIELKTPSIKEEAVGYQWELAKPELALKAVKLVWFESEGTELPDSEIGETAKNMLDTNTSLISALSAAYLYYTEAGGNTHNSHGKDATVEFMHQLLVMKEKTHFNIQNEAIKFIKGEGIYGTWYGGGSSHNNHSRISYILDSGLLDDRVGEIFPYRTSSKCGFFRHAQSYAEIREAESREDLKDRVISIPTTR